MRKAICALVVGLVWFSVTGAPAQADGMILPETLGLDYLVVRYHQVEVDIEDSHAVTRVEQTFYNPHPFPVSGRYLFPVPPEAMLSRFEAVVDGQPQSAERQDVAATNALLYDAVVHHRDPSLLQYADWESLAFDLSLPAGGSREMILEYEQVLVPSGGLPAAPNGGLYHYRYILSVERYTSQPLEKVSVTVNLRSSSGLASIYSSSHTVTTEEMGPGQARITWTAQDIRPEGDFDLFFAPADGGFGGGLLTGQRGGKDHFLLLFAPEMALRQADVLPKDIVFVIDRSGSMGGEKIEQARKALHFVLGQLGEQDRFSIVGFNDRSFVWADALQPVDKEVLTDARRYVDRLSADGNTDIEGALQAGLEILNRSESRGHSAARMVVFLTDGLPTDGVTDDVLIARLVTEANLWLKASLHVFGVGYDVNTHLLDRLAADNGGSVTYVQPGENLETILTDFYSRVAHPVLTDIEIDFHGIETNDLYPQTVPDLFYGSSLLLAGRYRAMGDRVTVRVRGQAGGKRQAYVYHFDLSQVSDRDFVPRLWATRRVGELLDRVRVEGESPSLVQEIRELGMSYGVVTPYTSSVIEGQSQGPASETNNRLYREGDLNRAWGQTTIQARVQNQAYQQAVQADLAVGANVVNHGSHSLVRVGSQNVDLVLLHRQDNAHTNGYTASSKRTGDLGDLITEEWLAQNLDIDRIVVFGSEAYFALAEDPGIRPFLQSGLNVIFAYQGEVISVQALESQSVDPSVPYQDPQQSISTPIERGTRTPIERGTRTPEGQGHSSNSRGTRDDTGLISQEPNPNDSAEALREQREVLAVCISPFAATLLAGLAFLVVGKLR